MQDCRIVCLQAAMDVPASPKNLCFRAQPANMLQPCATYCNAVQHAVTQRPCDATIPVAAAHAAPLSATARATRPAAAHATCRTACTDAVLSWAELSSTCRPVSGAPHSTPVLAATRSAVRPIQCGPPPYAPGGSPCLACLLRCGAVRCGAVHPLRRLRCAISRGRAARPTGSRSRGYSTMM